VNGIRLVDSSSLANFWLERRLVEFLLNSLNGALYVAAIGIQHHRSLLTKQKQKIQVLLSMNYSLFFFVQDSG
jgi:hypothetical protein